MPMIACPGCGLPRTDETAAADACPICGHPSHLPLAEEHDDEPDHDQPWIIDEPPRPVVLAREPKPADAAPRRSALFAVGILAGFFLGVTTGVTGVLILQTDEGDVGGLAQAGSAADDTKSSDPADLTPRPRDIGARPVAPAPGMPAPGLKNPIIIGPPPRPTPFNPFRPGAPRAERLDNPQVYAPFLPPGGQLVARGRVRRLIVSGLEKGAILDCSELESQEVIVVGKIDGGSRLALFTPGGKVRFLSKVDGRSLVDVRAPGGDIDFETPTEKAQEGSRISGGAIVDVLCRSVRFRGHISGAGTQVSVRLHPEGSLEFVHLDDHARLECAKDGPGGGTPKIKKGKVEGKAVVKFLD